MRRMQCRPRCAACCIAPSISTPIPAHAGTPGLPGGKPAGLRCPHLDPDDRCRLFGQPTRPRVCSSLRPSPDMCGDTREHAMLWLQRLERTTGPGADVPRRPSAPQPTPPHHER
jgi:hypothetical protein